MSSTGPSKSATNLEISQRELELLASPGKSISNGAGDDSTDSNKVHTTTNGSTNAAANASDRERDRHRAILHGVEQLKAPSLPTKTLLPRASFYEKHDSLFFGGHLVIRLNLDARRGNNTEQQQQVFKYKEPITVCEFLKRNNLLEIDGSPVLAVKLNNEVAHLNTLIDINSTLELLTLGTEDGCRVYRKSLAFLLAMAASHVLPDRRICIGYSIHSAYFFYDEDSLLNGGDGGIPQHSIELLAERMKQIAQLDMPIYQQSMSYLESVEYFQNIQPYTHALLKHHNEPKVTCYRCGDFVDLSIEVLVHRTGLLDRFEVTRYNNGLLVHYPQPDVPFKDNECLYKCFMEHKLWGRTHNFSCVGQINEIVMSGGIDQFIQVIEALHDKKIIEIAEEISRRKDVKVILIAGPSSSGKTSTARKLAVALKVNGISPFPMSLDDYYLPHNEMPRGPDGKIDYEELEALDIELLNSDLLKLFNGEIIQTPRFDFRLGTRQYNGDTLMLPPNGVLILEGIHGLNDKLTPKVARENKFKIFVTPVTQVNIDDHNRVPTSQLRLLRRIVRDNQFRGYTALETLQNWHSVRQGEVKHIFPFQSMDLDATFNTALDYEVGVLKVYAEPLLRTVKPNSSEFTMASRLLALLAQFTSISSKYVPDRSLLREFIGGSLFAVH